MAGAAAGSGRQAGDGSAAGDAMKFVTWLMTVAFFTASFDIILTVNVGGTLRLAQVVMVFVILAAMGHIIQTNVVVWPRGMTALTIWCAIQGVLIGNSESVLFSLQLYVLLLLAVLGVFATVQLYGRSEFFELLFRRYLYSYVFVAAFGMWQFVTPGLHLGTYLIRQWIIHGVFPRINGFNYEPSYFATYMTIGWVLLLDLRLSKAKVTQGQRWMWGLALTSGALFFSTSKTAWLGMGLEAMLRVFPYARRYVAGQLRRLREGNVATPLPRLRALMIIGLLMVGTVAGLSEVNRVLGLDTFLSGTGLAGTAAHSYNDREWRYQETLMVFEANPWIGVSLGGVAPKVAAIEGVKILNLDDQKRYWGFPVIVDTLAASGAPGFLPFLWFFGVIMLGENKLIRERWEYDDRAKWLHALVRALALEWFVLLSDQFLLRVYFWMHVGMVVLVAYNLRYVPMKVRDGVQEERLVAA